MAVAHHPAELVDVLACGPALKAVLQRATEVKPALRFEDAARFCEALRGALASPETRDSVRAPPAATGHQHRRARLKERVDVIAHRIVSVGWRRA
jgi:hypothetical protein